MLWGEEIEDNLERADNTTRRIRDMIKAILLEEQEREVIEKHKKDMEFERQLLEQREEFEKACEHEKAAALESGQLKSSVAAKLPKLLIMKFNYTPQTWQSLLNSGT